MKKISVLFLFCLVLISASNVMAEPSDELRGIYNALIAEDSDYSKTKAMYIEYFPGTEYEETLDDDSFTISINGNEYMDGSWTYTQDGDYLKTSYSSDDFSAAMMTTYIVHAIGDYYDMDASLLNGYVNGLSIKGIENDNFILTQDENTNTTDVSMYIGGPYDMKELDHMVLDDSVLYFDPLDEDYTSMVSSIGGLMMVANGDKNEVTILLGEYDGLDQLAYESILNVVETLQPEGWETFVTDYSELANAETAGYSVMLDIDISEAKEIIDDVNENYHYALLHFGK